MNGPFTFTTDEVAGAIGILHLDPGVVDCFYQPLDVPTADPCLAVRGAAQDAFRLIVRLHTNRIHANVPYDDHAAHHGAELVATQIDRLPVQVMRSSISGAVYYWPDIQVADQ